MRKNMTLALARRISKELNIRILIDGAIQNGELTIRQFDIWLKDWDTVKAIRTAYDLGEVKKDIGSGSPILQGANFRLWSNTKCKVTGYSITTIPERTEKTPIYECE